MFEQEALEAARHSREARSVYRQCAVKVLYIPIIVEEINRSVCYPIKQVTAAYGRGSFFGEAGVLFGRNLRGVPINHRDADVILVSKRGAPAEEVEEVAAIALANHRYGTSISPPAVREVDPTFFVDIHMITEDRLFYLFRRVTELESRRAATNGERKLVRYRKDSTAEGRATFHGVKLYQSRAADPRITRIEERRKSLKLAVSRTKTHFLRRDWEPVARKVAGVYTEELRHLVKEFPEYKERFDF